MGVVITNVELLPGLVVTGNSASPNLLRNTNNFAIDTNRKYGWKNLGGWSFETDSEGITVASKSQTGLTSDSGKYLYSSRLAASKGDIFTCSCWFMVDDVDAWDSAKRPYVFEVYSSSYAGVQYDTYTITSDYSNKPTVVSGKWVMFRTYNTVTATNAAYVGMKLSLYRNGSIHIKNCKIEKGKVENPIWIPENTTTIRVAVKETVTEPTMYRLPMRLGEEKGGIK